jgi:hypothetical protein
MSRSADASDSELGRRLAEALERRARAGGSVVVPTLDSVRSAARRRRRNTRAVVAAACVALVGLTGAAVVSLARDDSSPSAPSTTVAPVHPAVLPVYLMLADESGSPAIPDGMSGNRGGQPTGRWWPAIDVWARGDQRLIIRTHERHLSIGVDDVIETTSTVAPLSDTTVSRPWGAADVVLTDVRGTSAAVQQLAPDQFAVWVLSPDPEEYAVVIGRGYTADALLADIEAMSNTGGHLAPSGSFELVELHAEQPDTAAQQPNVRAVYGPDGEVSLTSTLLREERRSLEAAVWEVGPITQVAGRDVVTTAHSGQIEVSWIDPSGVLLTAWSVHSGETAESLLGRVVVVPDGAWTRAATALSDRLLRSTDEVASAGIGDMVLSRRRDADDNLVFCVGEVGHTPQCRLVGLERGATFTVEGHAEIGGQWIAYGYSPDVGGQGATPPSLRFRAADGREFLPTTTSTNSGTWYLTRIADDVDLVTAIVDEPNPSFVPAFSRPYAKTLG